MENQHMVAAYLAFSYLYVFLCFRFNWNKLAQDNFGNKCKPDELGWYLLFSPVFVLYALWYTVPYGLGRLCGGRHRKNINDPLG